MSTFTDSKSGTAQNAEGQTINTFLGSVGASAALFGVQFLVFYLLRLKLVRIYQPKTYLLAEKNRTKAPPAGIFKWVLPVFRTSNAELISKCGLDAYFFLRYLRMLLKIFIPGACVILPILLPINYEFKDSISTKGLDKLGWQNYDPAKTSRLWAHLIMAVLFLFWTGYIIHDELRGYIRVRQAYLTSPRHRLRASATTVLVTAIPRKWLSFEALEGLYDVFPGGIRNIWINRNFDELADKVSQRDQLAQMLEAAETSLVRNAKAKHVELKQKEEKKAGIKRSKKERAQDKEKAYGEALRMAFGAGFSTGDPYQARNLDEELSDGSNADQDQPENSGRSLGILGEGLGNVGHGFARLGKNLISAPKALGQKFDNLGHKFEETFEDVNEGGAFSSNLDGSIRNEQRPSRDSHEVPLRTDAQGDPIRLATTDGAHGTPYTMPRDNSPSSLYSAQDFAERSNRPQAPGQQTIRAHNMSNATPSSAEQDQPTLEVTRPSTASNSAHRASHSVGGPVEPPSRHRTHVHMEGFLQPAPGRGWRFWKTGSHNLQLPSPEPRECELNEFPFRNASIEGPESKSGKTGDGAVAKSKFLGLFPWGSGEDDVKEEYPVAFDETYDNDEGDEAEPAWKKYLSSNDRDTMRLPLFGQTWLPFMPSWTFIGTKVDTIYYCRKEVARLNLEIEQDQQEPQKYPLMNSAFIQFNHQVAAHMACQSVSHHVPNRMAPRIVEISPDDIIWENMSIKWWERFLRVGIVFALVAGLVIAWAVPVSLSATISNLQWLAQYGAFKWINSMPKAIVSGIQGVLPWLLLAILLAVLPMLLRFAAKQQGVHTGMAVELSVQGYYFAFLFVQLFLVVSIATSIFKVLNQITLDPTKTPEILAQNIPKAGNYFFSYMLLQAFSTSASQLVQIVALIMWYIGRRIFDNTARQKFNRQTNFNSIQWGTFFPVYTNLACIGLIYSVISPLILVFNIITFGLFWIVYRYQILYVNWSRFDTGGLLFPRAINQLFTGLYVMELALIGLYALVRNQHNRPACLPQAIIMAIVLGVTVLYHLLVNWTFSPLYRYMPITLEDDAVLRDEEFARAQGHRWSAVEDGGDGEDIEDRLQRREQEDTDAERMAEEQEALDIKERRKSSLHHTKAAFSKIASIPGADFLSPRSWNERARTRSASHVANSPDPNASSSSRLRKPKLHHIPHPITHTVLTQEDLEKGQSAQVVGDALFGNFSDEIEDLSLEERDKLIQRAFLHKALRARRPAIWIPRDDLGVSDDEIRRTQRFSDKIWITNEFTGLDQKGRVLFSRAPPDFSEVDLIDL